jgi:hypothetical protein
MFDKDRLGGSGKRLADVSMLAYSVCVCGSVQLRMRMQMARLYGRHAPQTRALKSRTR